MTMPRPQWWCAPGARAAAAAPRANPGDSTCKPGRRCDAPSSTSLSWTVR